MSSWFSQKIYYTSYLEDYSEILRIRQLMVGNDAWDNNLKFLPIVSPVSSSSPTSTHLIEKGGSRWENPNNGGFEQLVTNWNEN